MRILHFSDVHVDTPLSAVPARDWLGKRLVGGLNHILRRRARFARSREKLAALAAFAEAESVDHAICTGDYTMLGTDVELDAALEAVGPLTGRPAGFSTIAGNHDVYVPDTVAEGRFEKRFAKWLGDDLPEVTADSGGLRVQLVGAGGEVAIVAVTSTRPNPIPWRSSGRVPEAQLAALGRVLSHPAVAERFALVITHYAPRLWNGRPDSALHGLENANALLAVLGSRPRTALLFGHVHRRYAVHVPDVSPMLIGAGSATDEGREGAWLLELERTGGTATPLAWRQDRWARDAGASIVELR